jgi:hypothetical protein
VSGEKRGASAALGQEGDDGEGGAARSRPRQRLDLSAADEVKMQRRRQVLAAIREDLGEPQPSILGASTDTAAVSSTVAAPAMEEGKVALKVGLKLTGSSTLTKPKANGQWFRYVFHLRFPSLWCT